MNEIETVNYLKQWAASRALQLSEDVDRPDLENDKDAKALAQEFKEWILPTEDIEYIALEDTAWTDWDPNEEYDPNNC